MISMPKRIKIFLSVLVLVSITISLLVVLKWELFLKIFPKRQAENVALEPTPSEEYVPEENPIEEPSPVLKDAPVGFYIFPPVEKEYLELTTIDPENPRSIVFSLPRETEIKAVFSGKVKDVLHDQKIFEGDEKFEKILLEEDDGEISASYIIKGEVQVKEGDSVKEGSILARSAEEGLSFSFWLNDKNGDFIKLSKEIFK